MEKNLILAIVLSVSILIIYNIFLMPKPKKTVPETPQVQQKIEEKTQEVPFGAKGKSIVLENTSLRLTVNTEGGVINSWYLKDKKINFLKEGEAIRFYLRLPDGENYTFSGTDFQIRKEKGKELALFWEDKEKQIKIDETINLPDQGYYIFYNLFIESPPGTRCYFIHPTRIGKNPEDEERLAYWESHLYKEKKEGVRAEYDSKIKWLGIREKKDLITVMIPLSGAEKGIFKTDSLGFVTMSGRINFVIYSGPQSYPYLRLVNGIVNNRTGEDYHLTDALNIGIWGYFSVGLSRLLIFFYSFTKNYGIAIILLTLLIYGALSPLSIKQFESMQKMQAVQPELKKVQQKFKNDPKKMQAEMMKIYSKYKINPMAGCLPMIIQLPIIFVLYRALLGFPFAENPSFLWIKNLGKPDIPLLLALAGCMFLQQRISQRAQRGKDQEGIAKIMQFFPLFLIVILWSLPSGVMLYWFTSTLISIIQQFFISKKTVNI